MLLIVFCESLEGGFLNLILTVFVPIETFLNTFSSEGLGPGTCRQGAASKALTCVLRIALEVFGHEIRVVAI
jgi:hypothetical protein